MPRFLPVQCHKCAVLQIKPPQKPGLKWCCSMCRNVPEVLEETPAACEKHSIVSDVCMFVKELKLEEAEEAEEMGAVANTFRGVENLGGAANWEGLYYQQASFTKVQHHTREWNQRRVCPIQIYEDESAEKSFKKRNRGVEQNQFLSSLWERWHQKSSKKDVVERRHHESSKKDVVELMEFARGVGNEENVPPGS